MEAESCWPGCTKHLFPLAVPVAPGRSLAHKKCLGRAKLEGDRATSIVVFPSPALGDPTAMVHRETTGMRLVCVSLGFGLDYCLGIGWEGEVATGLFPCILLSRHLHLRMRCQQLDTEALSIIAPLDFNLCFLKGIVGSRTQ